MSAIVAVFHAVRAVGLCCGALAVGPAWPVCKSSQESRGLSADGGACN